MVNLRYHIVSIVAVFLALGIGVFMGSSVIDSFTVDVLRNQQRNLEENLARLDGERRDLQRDLDELRARQRGFEEDAIPRLVEDRLDGVPIVIITVDGLDEGLVADVEVLLDAAGSDRVATVWMTDRMVLAHEGDARDLAEVLDFSATISPRVLRSVALARMAEALRAIATPPAVDLALPPDDEVPAPRPDVDESVLLALEAGGFLRVDRIEPVDGDQAPAIIVPAARLLVIGGSGRVDDADLLRPLLAALSPIAGVGMVAATPSEGDRNADPATIVELVRAAQPLAARIATVDNLDEVTGRLAAVLALEDLAERRVGHYGTGGDADRLVPAPRQ